MLFALMFVFGAWCLQQMPVLPNAYWVLTVIPALVGLHYVRQFPLLKSVGLALCAVLVGYGWALLMAHHRLADALPQAWEGKSIQIEGVVATLPQQLERGERFEFDVEKVFTMANEEHPPIVPRHISLTRYHNDAFKGMQASEVKPNTFHAGERWRLAVKLKRPHGTANPHGMDFELWALERNIRATGSIKHAEQRLATMVWRPAYLVEALREKIHTRMQRVLGERPYAGVLQALAIGDESGILQQDWQVFLRTGVNHLMSISGLHITMLSGLAFALMSAIWRRQARWVLWMPTRKAAVLAGLWVAACYALIAGFSVPTQRTLYMLAVLAWALWQGRHIAMARVLAYALLMVVMADPWAVLAPGFWLSFGAVALMSFALSGRLARPHWLREAIHTQWAVTIGLLPLLLALFQQFSLISPVANALAIPLVSLVVVPLTLLGAVLPIDSALVLAHQVMAWCMHGLVWLADFPLSTWQQHAPPDWSVVLAMLGVCSLLLPRGFPLRWLGWLALLPMLMVTPALPEQGEMKVSVLDVGQGLAVVVQTQHHAFLYDTGPRYSSQSDSGSRIIVPFLRGEGIAKLDGMVVSHNDSDHSGGMRSILTQVPVGWLATSLPASAEELATHAHLRCYAGQTWQWDGVHFEVMYPRLESYDDDALKDNNRSCVVRARSQFGSLLLTGDIEKPAESTLLEATPDKLASDVLVVPHHGSKTSSTDAFIQAVNPQVAIFTVGYRNRFGHPKAEVVARYQDYTDTLPRSDNDGAIVMTFSSIKSAEGASAPRIQLTRWRHQHHRYWQL